MDILSILIGVLIGVVLAAIWILKKGYGKDDASSEPIREEEEVGEAVSRDIYALAHALQAPIDQTAHPRDVLDLERFKEGVSLLGSSDYSVQDLVTYYKGGNWIISCIATEALCYRKNDDDVSEELLDHIDEIGPWPLFFVLRYFDVKASKNVVSRILLQAQDWWKDSVPMKQLVAEFAGSRLKEGETISIADHLEKCGTEDRKHITDFITSMKLAELEPLLEDIKRWEKERIDSSYLDGIGRIWRKNDTEGIIETELIKNNLTLLNTAVQEKPYHSILLIGESGVGKTALVKLFAKNLRQAGWTFFESSAADVMAGQTFIGELEGRVKKMVTALEADRKIIWYIPNFHELLHAGSHRYDPTGIFDRILPSIESGRVVVIGETTPEGHERLIQARKRLQSVLESLRVNPLPDDETLVLARKWIEAQVKDNHAGSIGSSTLAEAFQLVKQYLTDKTSPGNLMQFLQLTLTRLKGINETLPTITLDDLLVTLSQLTGLPKNIIDDRADLDIAVLRTFFQESVLGQQEAVDSLVERVAMLKAGLNDPSKPLGVFLFVGPTGTGKTEIAKKLAEALFGSSERMIRIDMSEYQSANDVVRILGESTEGVKSNTLVNQIRKQPFSVVLLDEFEKAHRNIWDLFLQVFDDGRLTDRTGNMANFRHSIIILTSNLGATIKTGSGIGFNPTNSAFSRSSVEKAVALAFRPEFVNRIDRVVIFHPLSRNIMRKILQKELNTVLQRRGFRNRDWAVEWEESAIEFLLNKGFTLDMGARPLKRAIEQYLLSPIAITIVEHKFPRGDQFLFVSSDGDQLKVEFIDPDAPVEDQEERREETVVESKAANDELQLRAIAFAPQGDPAEMQFLRLYLDRLEELIRTEEWASKKNDALARMSEGSFWNSSDRYAILCEIEVMDRIESGLQAACSLVGRLSGSQTDKRPSYARNLLQRLAEQLYLLDIAYVDLLTNRPHDAFLLVEATIKSQQDRLKTKKFFMQIWGMYQKWAKKRRMHASVLKESFNDENRYQAILAVSGFGAFTILEKEAGLHVLEFSKDHKTSTPCTLRVNVIAQPEAGSTERQEMISLAESALRNANFHQEIIRRYRFEPSPLVRDNVRKWRTGLLDRVLGGDFDLVE